MGQVIKVDFSQKARGLNLEMVADKAIRMAFDTRLKACDSNVETLSRAIARLCKVSTKRAYEALNFAGYCLFDSEEEIDWFEELSLRYGTRKMNEFQIIEELREEV